MSSSSASNNGIALLTPKLYPSSKAGSPEGRFHLIPLRLHKAQSRRDNYSNFNETRGVSRVLLYPASENGSLRVVRRPREYRATAEKGSPPRDAHRLRRDRGVHATRGPIKGKTSEWMESLSFCVALPPPSPATTHGVAVFSRRVREESRRARRFCKHRTLVCL